MEFFNEINWGDLGTKALTISMQLILLLLVFAAVRGAGKKLIGRSFAKMSETRNIHEGRTKTLEKLSVNIFSYILIFILITLIAGVFEYNVSALIAGAGIVGLAIGFGAQGLVSDVVTGFFILLEKQIEVDEYISVSGLDGIVEEVGLRTTQIRGFDGTVHYIPNRNIGNVSNHSRSNMRALVDMSIAYDENIDEAISIMQKACDQVASDEPAVLDGPHVVGVQGLGDSDVVIRIIAQTANMEQWGVERKLRKAMKEALDANNIEIPFPHQVYIQKNEK
ncbi:mechanosensitive ion channel family protein [Salisediminibacterium beveridgei]|uniref:Potassium efflux system KefA protein / Small-conductance mechanosensitive channel n=1 Tax=Salisediminibacterium beveridgei TaxID=632773 RepID=A0A1D7QWE8_9BACI|nr:mechanosensitive ion channel family protein [Salisediminibacterium beveridgei]AOM83331.1 Potassium efflux system KefA protein / Small-conductance mechanosensitive channel [Salisediminibacterium beveridgei]